MIKRGKNMIHKRDFIAPSGSSQLHMREDEKHQTVMGGLLSICITIYVLYVSFTNGKKMLLNKKPDFMSIEQGYEGI